MGLQNDVFEGGAVRIVIDAGESLVEPCAEVACKNQLAFTVHSGIACVLVPSLPNRGAAFGDHIAPTGACGAGGDLEKAASVCPHSVSVCMNHCIPTSPTER